MRVPNILVLAASALVAAAGCSAGRPQDGETPPGPALPAAPAAQDDPVPPEILAALPTCSISVSLYPQVAGTDDPGPGLRNVSLYVPDVRLEPPALWPDGTPVSADLDVEEDTARQLLAILAAHGFFSRATPHHSEARPSPATPPPAGSTAGLPERAPEPNVEVTVRVHDEDWHSLRIASWPLGDECRALLEALAQTAGGEAASSFDRLRAAF